MRYVFSKAFTPPQDLSAITNQTDAYMTFSLLYQLGYTLRLYNKDFPADMQRPLDLLQGCLAIPIVFSTAIWEYANATALEIGELVPLPPELEATASGAKGTLREMPAKWTVIAFYAIVAALLMWLFGLYAWILMKRGIVLPNTSSFPEFDVCSKATYASNTSEPGSENDMATSKGEGLSSFLRKKGLANAETTSIIKGIRGTRIRICADNTCEIWIVVGQKGETYPTICGALQKKTQYH